MEEVVKIKQIIVGGTMIIGLLSWLFVSQGNSININRKDIQEIQMNDNVHNILIKTLIDEKQETKQDLKEIKNDINQIKLAIESIK